MSSNGLVTQEPPEMERKKNWKEAAPQAEVRVLIGKIRKEIFHRSDEERPDRPKRMRE